MNQFFGNKLKSDVNMKPANNYFEINIRRVSLAYPFPVISPIEGTPTDRLFFRVPHKMNIKKSSCVIIYNYYKLFT